MIRFKRVVSILSALGIGLACLACDDKPAQKPSDQPAPAVSKTAAVASYAPKAETPAPEPGGIKNVPRDGEFDVDRASSTLGWTDNDATEEAKAHFTKYEAKLEIKDGKPTSLTIKITTSSLTSENKKLAQTVKTNTLDSVNNSKASFESESVSLIEKPDGYEVEGKITFRMTKKPITFPVKIETRGADYRVTGDMGFMGANFGTSGKLGLHLDLVFPFPN